jgi:inner membrane transporter RhtA
MSTTGRGHALGWALFVCSGVCSQIAAALATKTFGEVGAAVGTCLTFSLGGLLVLVALRPRPRGWSRRRRLEVVGLGALIVVNAIFVYMANEHLPLGTTITIEFLGALGVAVAHAHHRRDYLIALFALGGVALVSAASPSTNPLGILFALGGAGCLAIYIVAGGRVASHPRPRDSLAAALVAGGVLALPGAVVGGAQIGQTHTLVLLVVVAVVGRVLPYGFEIAALARVSAGSAGILFSIIPAIAALSGFVLLGQDFSALQTLGLAVVILAGALVIRDAEAARGGRLSE